MRVALDVVFRERGIPLHAQLAEAIRGAIREGHYRPGERVEPEREFMRVGNLSYPTVARAFREVAEEGWVTRKVGCGTFVADPLPKTENKNQTLGFIYYTQNEFFGPIFAGIEAECARQSCSVVPLFEQGETGGEDRALRELEERGVAGILAVPSLIEREHRELMRLIIRRVPVVLMDTYLPEIACDAVVIDNEGAAEKVAEHLLRLGHRRIVFISVPVQYPYATTVRGRIAGLRRALSGASLGEPWTAELSDLDLSLDDGLAASVDRFVADVLARRRSQRPTAVMCGNDVIALNVVQSLNQRGLRVPDDMSVTGFDDLSWARSLKPPLTTVAQPLERIGRRAARLLLDRLCDPDGQPVRVELEAHLVIRESSSTPPQVCTAGGR